MAPLEDVASPEPKETPEGMPEPKETPEGMPNTKKDLRLLIWFVFQDCSHPRLLSFCLSLIPYHNVIIIQQTWQDTCASKPMAKCSAKAKAKNGKMDTKKGKEGHTDEAKGKETPKVKVKAKCKALLKAKSKALPKGKPKAKAKASKAGIDKNHILKQFEILHKPGRVLGLRFIKISPQRY